MKRLIVVDISSFIFRAFFAIRPMTSPKGLPVNAVYGVLTMLMKLLQNYKPTHVVLARDTKGGSFRNEMYPEYKANRSAPPDELIPQFALIEELIQKMEIPALAMPNYEADDIIGSFAVQFKDQFDEILIASGDKDLMQFIGGPTKMVDTMKDKIYGRDEVFEKMGVYPEQIVDYLSLLGDSSDNIPGVKGIGAKGASQLLADYKTLDNIFENIAIITNKRAKTALEKNGEDANLSKKLVNIVTDLELGFTEDSLKYTLEGHEGFLDFLDELNFKSIKAKVSNGAGNSIVLDRPKTYIDYEIIKDQKKYDQLFEKLNKEDQVYVEPFFTHDDYHLLDPRVLGLATGKKNYLIYCDDFSFEKTLLNVIEKDILIVCSNVKTIYFMMLKNKQEKKLKVFDITQAHFVFDPEKKHNLQSMSLEFLSENIPLIKELRKENTEEIASVKNFEYGFAKRLYCGLRIYPWLQKKLIETNLNSVYETIDAPLQAILTGMEWEGIRLDTDFYSQLEKEFTKITSEIDLKVKDVCGKEVNLKSPKQVRELLFDDLELPVIKKTKTGPSTDSSVLETLARMGESEIPSLILKYREIEKLNSTYVKALPELVHTDGKLHTHFNQHIAQTGRLSSDKPNLQNIPVKTENGRQLRKGFRASPGCVLIGADYSQVELRLLAHFSDDPVMVSAFNNNQDIHAQTASEVFDIALENVTKEDRSYAKAINFGLMYGQSSFGLSQMLGISPGEAKSYIINYFTRFSKVKAYLDSLKEKCEKTGYSETFYGRKRYIKDINSSNRQMKSMAERMAINSPIQGTAADIIKVAMINIDKEIQVKTLNSKMLLQVHDELIFEVPENEIEQMKELIKDKMESAVSLSIPLTVDMGVAENWYDLK
ncbi:MAG: DNA polymerase I [Halobacteriovoraceae bacterium]|jgi:DNA polymerase I|nr:DNA polymerase I [Halobacteriovoraceae bacterium]